MLMFVCLFVEYIYRRFASSMTLGSFLWENQTENWKRGEIQRKILEHLHKIIDSESCVHAHCTKLKSYCIYEQRKVTKRDCETSLVGLTTEKKIAT